MRSLAVVGSPNLDYLDCGVATGRDLDYLDSMKSWVDTATEAFETALADLVAQAEPGSDPSHLGRTAALGAVAGSLWTDELGPFYDSDGVRVLLGNITKQAVSDRVRRHRLLALRTGSGRLVYPAFQFQNRMVIDGFGDLLATVAPDDTEGWFVGSWLTTPDPSLDGHTPLDYLRANGLNDALRGAGRDVAASLRG